MSQSNVVIIVDCDGETQIPIRIRKPWQRERLQTVITGETKTQQSHFDQTDVNAIVARFQRTGYMPPAQRQASYADVSGMNLPLSEALEWAGETISTADQFFNEHAEKQKAAEEAKPLPIDQPKGGPGAKPPE